MTKRDAGVFDNRMKAQFYINSGGEMRKEINFQLAYASVGRRTWK